MLYLGGCDKEGAVGAAVTVPENSWPAIQGKGGCHWYLPDIWRRSKKLVLVAWTAMVYCSAVGVGSGTEVTLRSKGP